ncbi:MAG: HupE/UreJ family protein [Deltaproteobacteria bacterium]|nr:HupE/UreJ family protein [Deltaproteobacteria bacterium]
MSCRACTRALVLALALVALPSIAAAHPLAPSYLRVALGDGEHAVTIRHARAVARPLLRTDCVVATTTRADEGELVVIDERWACPPEARVTFVTEAGRPPLVVEITRGDQGAMRVLDAGAPTLALTEDGGGWARWVALGAEHLAIGLDHVLVIIALVALVGLRRRLVWALTAFTLGHSLSLALAATGALTLPPAAVEVAIALTLVALGLELVAAPREPRASVLVRRPWIGGVAIGLVHGLGFAGVLGELVSARASGDLAPALIGFNLGLELAQLALVLALWLVARAARALPARWPLDLATTTTGWVVGVAGAAWVFDRAWP